MIMRVPGAGKKRNRKINITPNQIWTFLKCTPLKKTVKSFLYVCTILASIMDKISLTRK
jgi:hypothetical protein